MHKLKFITIELGKSIILIRLELDVVQILIWMLGQYFELELFHIEMTLLPGQQTRLLGLQVEIPIQQNLQ